MLREDPLQSVGDGQRALHGAAVGLPGRGGAGQFDQGERISGRLLQHAHPGAPDGRGRLSVEQPVRCLTAQRTDVETLVSLVEPGQHGRGAHTQQQRDGFPVHASGHEGENVQRRAVDPLGIVDHHEQRRRFRQLRHQGENRETDQHAVRGLGAFAQTQGRPERGVLPRRQAVQLAEDRAEQLMKAREPEVRLGLAADRSQHPSALAPRAVGREVEQYALAGPGFPREDQHLAVTPVGGEAPQDFRGLGLSTHHRQCTIACRALVPSRHSTIFTHAPGGEIASMPRGIKKVVGHGSG